MKAALLTYYLPTEKENYEELAKLIVPERTEYCKKHNYTHLVGRGPYSNPALYYAVQRIHLLYDVLFHTENPPDYVWVLNIQSVITNHNIPFLSLVENDKEHDFWVSKDCHATNMGSFIVRRSEWTKEWLGFIAREAPYVKHDWHEQAVVVLNEFDLRFKDKIGILPQNAINSYDYTLYPPWGETTPGHWKKGDLVLSLPGLTLKQRLDMVNSENMKERIIK